MQWTPEQIEDMTALGIDPGTLPAGAPPATVTVEAEAQSQDLPGVGDKAGHYSREYQPDLLAAWVACGLNPATLPVCDAPAAATPVKDDDNNDLTDIEFGAVQPLLPPEPLTQDSIPNKAVLDALLWCNQRAGRRTTQIPSRYGSHVGIRKRAFERWAVARVWDRILASLDGLEGLSELRRHDLKKIATAQARRGERIRACRSGAR